MSGRGRGMQLTRPAWMQDHRSPAPSVSRRPYNVTPSDWVRAHAADGRPYWYSLSTGQTTWNDPTYVQNDSPKSNSNTTESPAPRAPQWKKIQTEDGRTYYYNTTTKQTQWTVPDELSSRGDSSKPTTTSAPSIREPTAKATVSKQNQTPEPLPQGWVEHRTPDGRIYYYHSATRETRWERPAIPTQTAHRAQQPSEASRPSIISEPSKHHERPTLLPVDWAESRTADGRIYYYNKVTRETSWKAPLMGPDLKKPRIAANTDLRNIVNLAREQKDGTSRRIDTTKGVIRRPRSSEGKPLSDKAAEKHFLRRAKAKDDSLQTKIQTECGESDGARPSTEVEQLQEKKFQDMLKDKGISEKTTWLVVMSRCTGDQRYLLVEPYGRRKHVWMKYTQKLAKLRRRNAILKRRRTAEEFLQLLGVTFEGEPYTVLSLHRCRPEAVRSLEADARYKAVDERERPVLIKSFFSARARRGAVEQAKRRRRALDIVRRALDECIHPSLRPPKEEGDAADQKENVISKATSEHKSTAEPVTQAPNSKSHESAVHYFDDLTSSHELEMFVRDIPESSAMDKDDVIGLIRSWRRNLHSLIKEKRAREREAKRAQQREYRAAFRSGVESMILSERLPTHPRWKDVCEMIAKESFARAESELDARPVDLFEDGIRLFEDRVQSYREEFKRLLKDAAVEITENTTIEELQKSESVGSFLKTVEAPVAATLLSDRQRKEIKKKQKERDRAFADFDDLLRRFDAPLQTSFEEALKTWKDNPTYLGLEKVIGADGLRKSYDEFMQWRKEKEEKRAKRKFEQSHGMPYDSTGISTMENVKRARVAVVNHDAARFNSGPQQEEDSGWAAAISAKPVNETKLEERERRKKKILESLNST